ncbi:MAG: GIY-YIG nuclease family protein [Alphaproteobacteria bacterium]|nr:GIY-YIG nuclease family protein [Alphaproteobacteria bacterium]
MFYVYLIKSKNFPEQRYIGLTDDLKKRLADHNSGCSFHTSKYAHWVLINYIAFTTREGAAEFEKYLKGGSGGAFANKRFWK